RGRLISATHVAFASTRVMATAAHIGQAMGMAAFIANETGERVEDLAEVAHQGSQFKERGTLTTPPSGHASRGGELSTPNYSAQYLNPRDILTEGFVPDLQNELLKAGQHIPKFVLQDDTDLVQQAKLHASSSF